MNTISTSAWRRASVRYADNLSTKRINYEIPSDTSGNSGVVETALGVSMDLGEIASRLYVMFYRGYSPRRVLRRVLRLIHTGLLPNVAHGSTAGQTEDGFHVLEYWTRRGERGTLKIPPSSAAFVSTPAKSPHNLLVALETLGAVAFSRSGPAPGAYSDWRTESQRNPLLVHPPEPAEWTPQLSVLGAALDVRWLPRFGPLGWYWLLPVLFLYETRSTLPGGASDWVPLTEGHWRVRDPHIMTCTAGEWDAFSPVVFYTQSLLCAFNGVDGAGGRVFVPHPGDWHGTTPEDDTRMDVHILLDEGLPVSVATTQLRHTVDTPDPLYEPQFLFVHQLCSLTRSGGGTMMIRTLQRMCIDSWVYIELESTEEARPFYLSHGFRDQNGTFYLRWFARDPMKPDPLANGTSQEQTSGIIGLGKGKPTIDWKRMHDAHDPANPKTLPVDDGSPVRTTGAGRGKPVLDWKRRRFARDPTDSDPSDDDNDDSPTQTTGTGGMRRGKHSVDWKRRHIARDPDPSDDDEQPTQTAGTGGMEPGGAPRRWRVIHSATDKSIPPFAFV